MRENINHIFTWIVRIGLIAAALVVALKPEFNNQSEIVAGLTCGAIMSFIFLQT